MASHDVPDKVKKFLEKRKEQNIARFNIEKEYNRNR